MSNLGIGLGAFMDGFERGQAIRERWDKNKLESDNRAALQKIDDETKAQFDDAVSSGDEDGKNYDKFWTQYALPRRKQELLRQGDVAGAKELEDWGNSDSALRGGRFFASAMRKAQTGDPYGALQDAIKAGKVKGYIDHGYELSGLDELVDKDGNLLRYRLKVKGQDGKELTQDIEPQDVESMIATYANPDAAWQSQLAKREAKDKQETELDTYEKKKKLDRKYDKGTDDAENYRKAREARMKNDLDFADKTPEEQDAAIKQDLEAADNYAAQRNGTAGGVAQAAPAPKKKILVDQQTGEPVSATQQALSPAHRPSPPEPDPNAVGVQGAPAPNQQQGPGLLQRAGEFLSSGPTASGVFQALSGPSDQAATPAPPPSRDQLIGDAADNMVNGGNPEMIGQRLMQAGIPPEQWPAQLQQAFRKRQAAPGLGQ